MRVGVRTLLIAVAGLSAIAIAVSGCTGDSDAEAESPPATTTGQVETQPPARSAVDIFKFRVAFKETFGERPWYGQITGMKMGLHGFLEITTKLDESDGDTRTICGAAMRFALDGAEGGDGIEGVLMRGSDGAEQGGCA
jgi:hypothetical protein